MDSVNYQGTQSRMHRRDRAVFGEIRRMPKPFQLPDNLPPGLVRAIEIFRRPVYVVILVALKDAGRPMFYSEILKATEASHSGVSRALAELEDLGVVRADIPREMRVGRSARYELDLDQYAEAVAAFLAYVEPKYEENT